MKSKAMFFPYDILQHKTSFVNMALFFSGKVNLDFFQMIVGLSSFRFTMWLCHMKKFQRLALLHAVP